MANTFLYAQGADLGASLCEKDMKDDALAIMSKAEKCGCKIILPTDMVCVQELGLNASFEIHDSQSIPNNMMAVDMGPESCKIVSDILKDCKTVLWNGPVGVFELKPFDAGTNALALAVAQQTQQKLCTSVAGGGDTVAALTNAGVLQQFSYISTAGGAFLEWIEGKELPGVAALAA